MSVDTAILRFRQRQASVFRDTAVLERPSTTVVFNPTTGTYTPAAPTQIHSGACLIRGFGWEGTDVEAGGLEVRLRRYKVKFAVNIGGEIDDVIRPTASTYDASLVGRELRVTDVPRDGWQISRWMICEEITGDV